MAKIILHPLGTSREEIERQRLLLNLERTPNERISLMFALNAMALMMKKGPLKLPQAKGIVLKEKTMNLLEEDSLQMLGALHGHAVKFILSGV